MALVTTAGASNADSYISLAAADAYFTARGVSTWTGDDTAKEAALRRATTYLDNQYRERWIGTRSTEDQALAWPRRDGVRGWGYPLLDTDGFDIAVDAIPEQIQHATAEAALLLVIGSTLEPVLERGGAVKMVSKKVGPISKSTTYSDGASMLDRYVVIDGLLRGLVRSTPGNTSGNLKVVRS